MKRKLGAILLVVALAVTLGLVPAASVGATSPGPGIVGLWHLDDGTGSDTASDSSGNGNNGTLTNINTSTCWVSDQWTGNALDFDGIDDYVDCGDVTEINGLSSFTVEFWVKVDSLPFSEFEGIIARGSSGQRCPWVYGHKGESYIRVHFETITGGAADGRAATADLTAGQWHHVAFTWDGATVTPYLDGVAGTTDTTTGDELVDTDGSLKLGYIPGYAYFDGQIDEVRIWDTATPSFNLEATPDEDINPIDTDHTITATVTIDKVGGGTEVAPGVLVDFAVSGVNTNTGSDYTDSNGQAALTYTGDYGAGVDTITAEIDQDCYQYADVSVTKYWVDRFVSGGGQLIEAPDGTKRKDWLVISFGGAVGDAGTAGFVGEWEVNFHNVNIGGFDSTKFHTTSIQNMTFLELLDPYCIAMNFTAIGKWQGTPGYEMIFRAEDAGEPGSQDNVRIELRDSKGTKVYDTDWEFARESSCFGIHRTSLDHGNLQMDVLS